MFSVPKAVGFGLAAGPTAIEFGMEARPKSHPQGVGSYFLARPTSDGFSCPAKTNNFWIFWPIDPITFGSSLINRLNTFLV